MQRQLASGRALRGVPILYTVTMSNSWRPLIVGLLLMMVLFWFFVVGETGGGFILLGG